MASALKDALIAAAASLAITASSYFVTVEGVHLWLPRIDAAGTAIVHGFPIPYAVYFPTNESSYLFYPLNFGSDFLICFGVALLVMSGFTVRRLILASISGLAVTVPTLFLPSLALATPENQPLECSGTPMGFPFEYLFRLECFTSGVVSYQFSLLSAVVDYVLWSGVSFAIGLCLLHLASAGKHRISRNQIPPVASHSTANGRLLPCAYELHRGAVAKLDGAVKMVSWNRQRGSR
jgi:hypothetical protein